MLGKLRIYALSIALICPILMLQIVLIGSQNATIMLQFHAHVATQTHNVRHLSTPGVTHAHTRRVEVCELPQYCGKMLAVFNYAPHCPEKCWNILQCLNSPKMPKMMTTIFAQARSILAQGWL